MKLPPDVEFYEDIRLVVWRPHGLVNKAAVNKIITILGELETAHKEPSIGFPTHWRPMPMI